MELCYEKPAEMDPPQLGAVYEGYAVEGYTTALIHPINFILHLTIALYIY